ISVEERPHIKGFAIVGVKSSDRDDIHKKIDLRPGEIFTDNKKMKAIQVIKNYYVDKGFLNVKTDVKIDKDSVLKNSILVKFII
ncbi:POTRA domain-containing protein, partial [Acinetobacter baumannii]